MNQITKPRKQRSVTLTQKTDNFEELANLLRPSKSVFDMSDAELNKIDAFQNQNRGFRDSKKDEHKNY